MRNRLVAFGLACLTMVPAAQAATTAPVPVPMSDYKTTMQNAGKGFAIALPLIATGLTLYRHDRAGSAELLVSTVLSVATAYALNNSVREERPDDSSFHAFPALETSLAASSSSFILARYGWHEGLPAFFASGFVSYSLTSSKKEHWYDTLASSAISSGYGLLITRRFHNRYNISTHLSAAPDGGFVSMAYNF